MTADGWQRYRIELREPGGAWQTEWDELGRTPAEALKRRRRTLAIYGVPKYPKRSQFRAILEPGKLFGT